MVIKCNSQRERVQEHSQVKRVEGPHEPQIVEYIADVEIEEDNFEPEKCMVDNEGGITVDFSYKRKLQSFGKSKKRPVYLYLVYSHVFARLNLYTSYNTSGRRV
ncbi:PREDICTED: uncharacterized protein LOC105453078 [Wasmannia auropunctata]|uniref:uncharacterized protein LOC105453078 n=1 Tax=Wasmannia auropunctata TaxID=64793 RepID=UPI0005EEAA15|nr:PREDICTED: uncharacterized protein LOC105453078 [Wasmannia auropunctata]